VEVLEQRERIEEFLDSEERLNWQNFSVPEDEPWNSKMQTTSDNNFIDRLAKRMWSWSFQACTFRTAGGLKRKLNWPSTLRNPLLVFNHMGTSVFPKSVREAADEVVGWRQRSIVNAIARHG